MAKVYGKLWLYGEARLSDIGRRVAISCTLRSRSGSVVIKRVARL